MMPVTQRQWVAAGSLLVALIALLQFAIGTAESSGDPGPGRDARPRAVDRLAASQLSGLEFLRGEAELPTSGRDLFATEHFKPAPKPPPPPRPAPPATRQAPVVYRGFAQLENGLRFAYVEVDGKLRTLNAGDEVISGWKVVSFDGAAAILGREEANQLLEFNKRGSITVPASTR
jgi:hypothetical protein